MPDKLLKLEKISCMLFIISNLMCIFCPHIFGNNKNYPGYIANHKTKNQYYKKHKRKKPLFMLHKKLTSIPPHLIRKICMQLPPEIFTFFKLKIHKL